jgi:hypothetical protein
MDLARRVARHLDAFLHATRFLLISARPCLQAVFRFKCKDAGTPAQVPSAGGGDRNGVTSCRPTHIIPLEHLTCPRESFFSSDQGEPPHIHVTRDRLVAKFWLEPISFARNKGFREHELNRIVRLVVKHHNTLIKGWHDYFGA